jgi:hypothetical protein
MRKPRMFRRLICKMRESELANAPQTLKFPRINQADKQFACGTVGLQTNYIVNRIAVYSFCQFVFSLSVKFCGVLKLLSSRIINFTVEFTGNVLPFSNNIFFVFRQEKPACVKV